MITITNVEWILLAQAYHHVLAQSPSPEAAKIAIATASKNRKLRIRATLRERKAQPGLRLAPGETPPAAPVVTTPDYSIPPDTVFARFDWERSYATRRDPATRSLFEYVDIRVHRDDVLELWPDQAKAIDLPRSELEAIQAKAIDLPRSEYAVASPELAKAKTFELPPAMPPQIEGRNVTEMHRAVMRALVDIRNKDPSRFDALVRQEQRLDAVKKWLASISQAEAPSVTIEKRTLQRAEAHLRALFPNWKPQAARRRS